MVMAIDADTSQKEVRNESGPIRSVRRSQCSLCRRSGGANPGPGQVQVEMRAADVNPGEAAIRSGALADRFPAHFPSGEGSDLAGVVSAIGLGSTRFARGDEVLGWSWDRSSHAEYVVVPETQLIAKPTENSVVGERGRPVRRLTSI